MPYHFLTEDDFIQVGDQWLSASPEFLGWCTVQEGDRSIGARYYPGEFVVMRRLIEVADEC